MNKPLEPHKKGVSEGAREHPHQLTGLVKFFPTSGLTHRLTQLLSTNENSRRACESSLVGVRVTPWR